MIRCHLQRRKSLEGQGDNEYGRCRYMKQASVIDPEGNHDSDNNEQLIEGYTSQSVTPMAAWC